MFGCGLNEETNDGGGGGGSCCKEIGARSMGSKLGLLLLSSSAQHNKGKI
jgi:hypothetical protein